MKKITVQLTAEELQALVTLSENQFFRLKHIDPQMPGYKVNHEELRAARMNPALIAIVAVGTTIADRPPHRSVRARLRTRLLPRMSGGEACIRIRMQNAG